MSRLLAPLVATPRPARVLSLSQMASVRAVMRLFVDEDLTTGVSPHTLLPCDACKTPRPAPGFIRYEDRRFCNRCATWFEIDQMAGLVDSPRAFRWPPAGRRREERRALRVS